MNNTVEWLECLLHIKKSSDPDVTKIQISILYLTYSELIFCHLSIMVFIVVHGVNCYLILCVCIQQHYIYC